jgi:hypothetical protein
MSAQHPPDPVGRQADAAPLGPAKFGCDASGSEAWVPEGKGDHPLLDEDRGGVGHLGGPTLPGSQHLEAEAQRMMSPPVVGRGVDSHHSACCLHIAEFAGQGEDAQAVFVEGII